MYRLKKWQYIFYKHFLCHGLNVSLALSTINITGQQTFKLYWLSINAAYVLEFFLQTLVKKGHMRQGVMLTLNQVSGWAYLHTMIPESLNSIVLNIQMLMLATTAPALRMVAHVSLPVAAASLALQFTNRHHDFSNTVFITVLFALLRLRA